MRRRADANELSHAVECHLGDFEVALIQKGDTKIIIFFIDLKGK